MNIKVNLERTTALLNAIFDIERYPLLKDGELVYQNGQVVMINNSLGPKAIYGLMRSKERLQRLHELFTRSLSVLSQNFQDKSRPKPAEDATDEFKADYERYMQELMDNFQKERAEVLATEVEVELHCFSIHQLKLNDPLNRIPSHAIETCKELFVDIEELENI